MSVYEENYPASKMLVLLSWGEAPCHFQSCMPAIFHNLTLDYYHYFFSIQCMWPIYSLKYFFTRNPYIFSTEVCAFSETHPIPGQGWWKCQVFLLSMQWMEKALPPLFSIAAHSWRKERKASSGIWLYLLSETGCMKEPV